MVLRNRQDAISAAANEQLAGVEVGLEAARAVLDAARWQIVEPLAGEGTLLWERNRVARLGTLLTHLAPLLRVVAVALSGLTGWRKHSGSLRGVSVE